MPPSLSGGEDVGEFVAGDSGSWAAGRGLVVFLGVVTEPLLLPRLGGVGGVGGRGQAVDSPRRARQSVRKEKQQLLTGAPRRLQVSKCSVPID